VCVGGGPSLTAEDVDYVRDKADAVIAINVAWRLAPWATALYAADAPWWRKNDGVPGFAGLKYTLDRHAGMFPGVTVLRNTGLQGLDLDPTGLRSGSNSGYQAINLAVHFGAARILLLGYDMRRGPSGARNFHTEHSPQQAQPFARWIRRLEELPPIVSSLGIQIINCSRQTAVTCFPRQALREALPARAATEAA
jgi:hypothetical protein